VPETREVQGMSDNQELAGSAFDDKALTKSVLNFVSQKGTNLQDRTMPFREWIEVRRQSGTWPYSRVSMSSPADFVCVADERGNRERRCINFGSQDYLGLARDPRVLKEAKATIDDYGVHSAGSPALAGRTKHALALEHRLASFLRHESAVLFATGWAAGFGAIVGLARSNDTIVIDRFAHNCLAEGARHASQNILHFAHNDITSLNESLDKARQNDGSSGLFVIAESLYSMDSDSPNLNEMLRLVRQYDAILILDIAHDFGAMGKHGLGLLETIAADDWPDLILGSFSKTFASNGGFVAASTNVTEYLRYHSPSMAFSNGISPVQATIVSRALDIVVSSEGCDLRSQLACNVDRLRHQMLFRGLTPAGLPSPIVPVFVGDEKLARLTARHLESNGLLVNLVEFPAVKKGTARFRFQVMSTHGSDAIDKAAQITADGRQEAFQELRLRSRALSRPTPPILPKEIVAVRSR
jgi:7-keto-8-aminopelargonate synthetase-like enzyme